LRMGHLLALLHFGSMPTALCKRNIDLFAREVLPYLANQWDDKYEDRWWPERLKSPSHPPPQAGEGREGAVPAMAAAS
jgi:hypothetical protein